MNDVDFGNTRTTKNPSNSHCKFSGRKGKFRGKLSFPTGFQLKINVGKSEGEKWSFPLFKCAVENFPLLSHHFFSHQNFPQLMCNGKKFPLLVHTMKNFPLYWTWEISHCFPTALRNHQNPWRKGSIEKFPTAVTTVGNRSSLFVFF